MNNITVVPKGKIALDNLTNNLSLVPYKLSRGFQKGFGHGQRIREGCHKRRGKRRNAGTTFHPPLREHYL